MSVLVVDGANVVGSRPDGWWRDRPAAARGLWERLSAADLPYDEVVLVLEGQARSSVPAGTDGPLQTVHATRDGDSSVVAAVHAALDTDAPVVVVTADRALAQRVEAAGARVMSPSWLLDVLESGDS